MMDLISVIVPIFKVEQYINRCIDSILNQTYKNLEIILVDDGSPDNCPQICDQYMKKDKRIKVIHKKNGGLSDARNAGLDIASGNFVSFIDGDDYIHPQTFEILINVINESKAEMVCFHYRFIEPKQIIKFEYINVSNIETKTIESKDFLGNFENYYHAVSWISACTKVYKRELFNDLRYPYGKVDEDSYMLHHLASKCNKIARINEKLYYYVWTPDSISRSDFSPKRFDKNGANLDRVEFFHDGGIKTQEDFFKREYLLNTLKMYYTVKNEYPQFLKDFKVYKKEYHNNVRDFTRNNERICNIEKVIFNLFDYLPSLAEILYNKYIK